MRLNLNKIVQAPFILLIKLYQGMISPFTPSACRFTPTCSEYGIQAIKKYGVLKGIKLTTLRIFKCRPNGPSGYDPLP